ncbi:MAG: class I SAM-dependent methyltransferase [Miniphocaeibacter sp.]|uniref:tRNA (adenine(22)-N(1))-methyltransferase n=1 Tax=Miniphocaeibacter sp. TaxID=3100973 RepID=UPI0017AFA6E1|nr:SAM-dependent methyltransferase [Gallicola sp.]
MQQYRLIKIINMIENNSIVADIGTDHGLIPIFLSEKNIAKKIIASDISEKSLYKLIEKLNNSYLLDNIETRVSDGLGKYKPFEMDTIVISGMGGLLITDILKKDLTIAKSANNLILQANNSLYELRKFLHENGFKIIEEDDLFENDKYYQIIKTEVGLEKYENKYEYEFGKLLIEKKSKSLYEQLNRLIKINSNLIEDLKEIKNPNLKDRITELEEEILYYSKVRGLIED